MQKHSLCCSHIFAPIQAFTLLLIYCSTHPLSVTFIHYSVHSTCAHTDKGRRSRAPALSSVYTLARAPVFLCFPCACSCAAWFDRARGQGRKADPDAARKAIARDGTALHCLPACLPACLVACLPSCLPACLPAPQPGIRLEVVIGHSNHSKFCIPYLIFFVPPPIFHIPHLIFYLPPPIFYVSLQAVTKKGGFNSTFHHPRWQGQCQSGVHGITGKVYENIRWDT